MKLRLLTLFALGTLCGAVIGFTYMSTHDSAPHIGFVGKVQMDTATYQEPRLNNSVFVGHPGAPNGRVYLRFADDKTMNDTLGKNAQVTGRLKSVKLDNGTYITELLVEQIQLVP